jgi:DNA-binding NtrC family response regulator
MGKIQVLLVDDELEYAEALSNRLALDDIDSTVATDGEAGLEALERDPPDVMVLDLRMPGMEGMELLERVRKDHPGVQVIVLTGHGGKAAEEAALEGGAFQFLEKPVDYRGLRAVIQRAWGLTKRASKAIADDLRLSFAGDLPHGPSGSVPPLAPDIGGLQNQGLKVLLVDDEEDYVKSLSERMAFRDVENETAFSGEEAISIVGDSPPDVMVLDLNMPGLGGMEVLRRVKNDHPQMEVVILTGHGSPAEREEALKLGAYDYLNKPIGARELMLSVQAAGQKAGLVRPGKGAK